MKRKYKLYKIQSFNHDYKIIDISKKEYERLKEEYERDLKKVSIFYIYLNTCNLKYIYL